MLDINIGNSLTFNKQVSNLYKKASQKLHAIVHISNYLYKNKLRLIIDAFFSSQLGYCLLHWVFHIRKGGFFLEEGGWYCLFYYFCYFFCVCACFNNGNRSN